MSKLFAIILALPWFLSSIFFKSDYTYYSSLTLPFEIPSVVFILVWTFIYIMIAISSYKIIKNYGLSKEYLIILFINYIFNQLYTYFFFKLQSPFLGFVDSLIVTVTSLVLYYETRELDEDASRLLIPYMLWSTFATFYGLVIFFMNI